jgi:hypothetical protein
MKIRAVAVVSLLAAGAANASPTLFYSNNFESGEFGPGWRLESTSDAPRTDGGVAPFTMFAGRNSWEVPSLTLAQPAPAIRPDARYILTFDLYIFDNWTGFTTPNPNDQRFKVSANGSVLFSHSFSNVNANQTYRGPDLPRQDYGFFSHPDSIYRNISVPFTVPANENIFIRFGAVNVTPNSGATWGMDNVRLEWEVVPAPASLASLALAALAMGRRRR